MNEMNELNQAHTEVPCGDCICPEIDLETDIGGAPIILWIFLAFIFGLIIN